MPVSLYRRKITLKLMFWQLMTFVVLSAAFGFKSLEWGLSALAGGLAAWLPSAIFMLFACRHQAKTSALGSIAWSFAIGEGLKFIVTIMLLIVALGLFKAAFYPLGLTYLAVLIVQIVAPVLMSSYRT
ncbi:MAG: F0F1 ATP synthase subunit I [Yersinia sp. (in: enterobacteria)]